MKSFLLTLSLFITQFVFAATKTWTGATNSDWNTDSNWSLSGTLAKNHNISGKVYYPYDIENFCQRH